MRALWVRSRRRSWVRPDGSLRRWHPGLWVCAVVAMARAVGLLASHCPRCNGHGRVLGHRQLRRRRCTVCNGTGQRRSE